MSFIILDKHSDYEILDRYPFTIRKRDNKYEPKLSVDKDGYPRITLNSKKYSLHRLIAEQFIPNDDIINKTQVDHINGIRDDYHIENLRWVTPKRNSNNIHSKNGIEYEFVDELIGNSYELEHVSQWEFANYHVCGDKILYFDGDRYRVLIKHPRYNQWRVHMRDINGLNHNISKRKLQEALMDSFGLEFFNDEEIES